MKFYVIELCCFDCKQFIDFNIYENIDLHSLSSLLYMLHNLSGSLYRIYNDKGIFICDIF